MTRRQTTQTPCLSPSGLTMCINQSTIPLTSRRFCAGLHFSPQLAVQHGRRGCSFTAAFLSCTVALSVAQTCIGDSATWAGKPVSGDWNTTANWLPNTVPNGPADAAMFNVSNITDVTTSAIIEVNSIVFDVGATAFSVTTAPASILTFSGAGIVNDSANVQTFRVNVTDASTSGFIFKNNATVGQNIVFYNIGGEMYLENTANIGRASINVTGAGVRQGHLIFFDNATANEATIAVNGFCCHNLSRRYDCWQRGFHCQRRWHSNLQYHQQCRAGYH
jgi:hypothetical protein